MNATDLYKWKVCVRCFTFNHAPYIIDALNGFCMQETSFPFVCTIVDDASTDSEPEIIKSYLEEHFDLCEDYLNNIRETDDYQLVFVRHKSNKNCFFAVLFLKYNHRQVKKNKFTYIEEWINNSKYIAICEGDDYWIDPAKLQKQATFLEANPDYTICATNALTLWENGVNVPSYFRKFYKDGEFTMSQLIGNWAFATATLFYRRTVLDNYPKWTKQLFFGDMTLMLIATHLGKFQVLSSITAVYRKSNENENSVTRKMANKMDYVNQQQVKLYELFNEWTEGKYADEVLKEIEHRKKEVKFYKYRKKGRLVPYLMMPMYMIKKKLN